MLHRIAPFHLRIELAGRVLTARIQQEVDAFRAAGGWEGGGRDKVCDRRDGGDRVCYGGTGVSHGPTLRGKADHGCSRAV